MGFGIQHDVLPFQHFAGLRRAHPAQMRAQTRHQLGHRIGLDDIVIGPGFQAAHLVHFFGPRRQHQDRNPPRFSLGTDPAANL
jgi:hypothetical protein